MLLSIVRATAAGEEEAFMSARLVEPPRPLRVAFSKSPKLSAPPFSVTLAFWRADELAKVKVPASSWTEAALFSAAGHLAFVYGPGDIAQAHSADEWVELDQLQRYAESIQRIVDRGLA